MWFCLLSNNAVWTQNAPREILHYKQSKTVQVWTQPETAGSQSEPPGCSSPEIPHKQNVSLFLGYMVNHNSFREISDKFNVLHHGAVIRRQVLLQTSTQCLYQLLVPSMDTTSSYRGHTVLFSLWIEGIVDERGRFCDIFFGGEGSWQGFWGNQHSMKTVIKNVRVHAGQR